MSTSKHSSKGLKAPAQAKRKTPIDVDAPFDPELLKTAHGIARVIASSSARRKIGVCGAHPGNAARFRRRADTRRVPPCDNVRVETAVATMLETGETPPAAGVKRTEQINIRLTSEEKLILEEESERQGFEGSPTLSGLRPSVTPQEHPAQEVKPAN